MGVKRLVRFQDTKGDVQEFAHGSTDDGHFGFMLVSQVVTKGLDNRVTASGSESGQIEQATQMGIADFGQAAAAVDGGTRGALERGQSGKGSQLTSAGKSAPVTDLSQQRAGSGIADARDRSEEFLLMAQVRMLVNMVADLVFHLLDLLVEKSDMLLQALADGWTGRRRLEAIELLGTHLAQVLQIAHQRAQFLERRGRRRPLVGMLRMAEVSNYPRIAAISFGALQLALGVSLDARRVNQADRKSLPMQVFSQPIAIGAGSLHTGVQDLNSVPFQPTAQLAKPAGRIGKLGSDTLSFVQQDDIKLGFGDINPQDTVVHVAQSPL